MVSLWRSVLIPRSPSPTGLSSRFSFDHSPPLPVFADLLWRSARPQLKHLDGRTLIIKSKPGDVIKPVSFDPFREEDESSLWDLYEVRNYPVELVIPSPNACGHDVYVRFVCTRPQKCMVARQDCDTPSLENAAVAETEDIKICKKVCISSPSMVGQGIVGDVRICLSFRLCVCECNCCVHVG